MPEHRVETFTTRYLEGNEGEFNNKIEEKINEYIQNEFKVLSHQVSTSTYTNHPSKNSNYSPQDYLLITTQIIFVKEGF